MVKYKCSECSKWVTIKLRSYKARLARGATACRSCAAKATGHKNQTHGMKNTRGTDGRFIGG